MPNVAVRIVQSGDIITATTDSIPVIAEENIGRATAATIIANFLRGGSPAVQYIIERCNDVGDVTVIYKMLMAMSMSGEFFSWTQDETCQIATFTRKANP